MTYLLLLFCATISTGHKHFGCPIFCDPDKDAVPRKVFESYCLMEGSYTLLMEEAATATMANTSTLHHGLGHGLQRPERVRGLQPRQRGGRHAGLRRAARHQRLRVLHRPQHGPRVQAGRVVNHLKHSFCHHQAQKAKLKSFT